MVGDEPERLEISANGIRFAALAWGDPTAPLALCLHGYPDTAWTWRFVGPALAAAGRRVVAPFLRGYAPTALAPDDDYTMTAVGRDAVALRDALGRADGAALIGHDWGAVAAYEVARTAPGEFAAVTALAVPPPAALFVPFRRRSTLGVGLRQLRRSWYTTFQQLPGISERSLDRLIPKLWRDWSPGWDASEDVPRALSALPTPAHRRAALRYYRDNLRPAVIREGCKPAVQPLLYLQGIDDGCLGVELFPIATALLPEGSRALCIEDAGHFMQLEQSRVVTDAIVAWLNEVR